jgi:glyoxylase-like metal-dependent hydrolase (beta-lactamase superfamily II)
MQLVFEQIRTGGDRNFGYLLGDRQAQQAVLIDPSYAPEVLAARAADQNLRVACIVNTHGHPDHTNGNREAGRLTGAPVAGHRALPVAPDVPLADGQEIPVGALRLRFMEVPGHADDHLAIYETTFELLITGDLLFVGKVGGTEGDAAGRAEWDSLQRLLRAVPDSATVWPGHDYGARPASTIALERKTNPFLLCRDADDFLRQKAGWPGFKKRYGLK